MLERKLKIAIATSGRFHVCDLARELSLLGHDVKFYSWVPPWRTKKFGLPAECNRWVLPGIGYRALRARISRGRSSEQAQTQKLLDAHDRAVAKKLEPCDVVIAMSGMSNKLGQVAKEKLGAQLWIERGSRHILSQKEIMAQIPGARQVADFSVKRELFDYEQADAIAVLSKHCEDSFVERGFTDEKLVRNPLGVDITKFQCTDVPTGEMPTIIMTGGWSLRKGCDLLVDAWRKLDGVRLMHVGPVDDCPIPTDKNFVHVDKVEQSKLVEFYAQSHVFALASWEEGLATVQPQALACGLRLVCTSRTGGEDLRQFTKSPDVISVVPPGDVDALSHAMKMSIDAATKETGRRERLLPDSAQKLSWNGYAKRYSDALIRRLADSPQ